MSATLLEYDAARIKSSSGRLDLESDRYVYVPSVALCTLTSADPARTYP